MIPRPLSLLARRLRAASAVFLLAGCAPAAPDAPVAPAAPAALPAASVPAIGHERGDPAPLASALAWHPLGPLSFDDQGRSASIPFAAPPRASRSVALRVLDEGPETRWFAAEVRQGGASAIWPAGGPGYGLFVLDPAAGEARISLVDGLFGGPVFDPALLAPPARMEIAYTGAGGPRGRLDLRVAVLAGAAPGELLPAAWWREAAAEVGATLAAAGVDAAVSLVAHLPEAAPGVLVVTPGDPGVIDRIAHAALSALDEDGQGLFVPVVVGRGLRWQDPDGQGGAALAALSTRIGGGASPGPASVVLVALEGEAGEPLAPRGRWLGMILAHEIGHFLGLRHDEEAAAPGAAPTLMTARIASFEPGQLSLQPAQGEAMRRHPLVIFPGSLP